MSNGENWVFQDVCSIKPAIIFLGHQDFVIFGEGNDANTKEINRTI